MKIIHLKTGQVFPIQKRKIKTLPKFCALVQTVIELKAVQLISGDHIACATREVIADQTLVALNDGNL